MYDEDDIARSVRRLVAETLGSAWQLDLERKEVADDARPAGVVEMGASSVRRARTSIPQGTVEMAAPVTISLYPEIKEPREAGRAARRLASLLERLLAFGALGPTFADGRPSSGPERIPLYDYSNIPLVGTAAERKGPDHAHDVLWVEDYSTRPVQDPLDAQRWTVIAELRVSWEQPGRVGPDAPLATQGLIPTYVP